MIYRFSTEELIYSIGAIGIRRLEVRLTGDAENS